MKKAKQPLDAIKTIEEKIEQIEEKVEAPVERRSTIDNRPSSIVNRPLSLGERVTVSSLNADGVVTALGESDAEVQVGSLAHQGETRRSAEERPTGGKSRERRKKAEHGGQRACSLERNEIPRYRIEPARQTRRGRDSRTWSAISNVPSRQDCYSCGLSMAKGQAGCGRRSVRR